MNNIYIIILPGFILYKNGIILYTSLCNLVFFLVSFLFTAFRVFHFMRIPQFNASKFYQPSNFCNLITFFALNSIFWILL